MKTLRVIDLFCGAGGTSEGIRRAAAQRGMKVNLTVVNHWSVAIATHKANHPEAQHLLSSVDDVKPSQIAQEGKVDILWASPECTHHSIARGGKPVSDQSRASAWCVVRFACDLKPKIIQVENVKEFEKWGPLIRVKRRVQVKLKNGRKVFRMKMVMIPDPKRKGEIFQAWIAALRSIGYHVEWRNLVAADFGAPTSRKRLFVYATLKRGPIRWPDAGYASASSPEPSRKPWRAAKEIIDWSDLGGSIFTRRERGQKPLVQKTLNRIWIGLQKFGLREFFIDHKGSERDNGHRVKDPDQPLNTVTAQGKQHSLICPFLIGQQSGASPRSANDPVPTVATAGMIALVQPFIMPREGVHGANAPRSVDDPLPTIVTEGAPHLVRPFLVKLKGTNDAADIDAPAPTVCASGGHLAVANSFLVSTCHGNGSDPNGDNRRSQSVDCPLPTVAGSRGEHAVCTPDLKPYVITIDQKRGGASFSPGCADAESPLTTVTSKQRHAAVRPYLIKYYGSGGAASVDSPLDTITTEDRFGLVRPVIEINGTQYLLDIFFRMLNERELARAQDFPDGYKFTGNKTEIVKQIGNAVPPAFAEALALSAIDHVL